MKTQAIEFQVMAVGAANVCSALREASEASRRLGEAFRQMIDVEIVLATMPGEWPDEFTLLNRYLRTGVKPRYLFND